MSNIHLGNIAIQCPACGSTKFIQPNNSNNSSIDDGLVSCFDCGHKLTSDERDIAIRKIGKASSEAIIEAVWKALR